MKKCPNCGASLNPYMVRCEYCRSWVFDWDVLLKDGEKCYVSFIIGNLNGRKATLTTMAIPHVEMIEVQSDTMSVTGLDGSAQSIKTNLCCEIHTTFRSIGDVMIHETKDPAEQNE